MKKPERPTWFTRWAAFGTFAKAFISRLLKRRKTSESFTIFQSLKSIKLFLWDEILETNNLALLDVNYSPDKTYTPEELAILKDSFSKLYDDYFLKLNNKRQKAEMSKTEARIALVFKMSILNEAVNTLVFINNNAKYLKDYIKKEAKVYDTIRTVLPKFKTDNFSSIADNIDKVKRILTTLELEYERKYGLESYTDQKKNSLYKDIVAVEQVLGRAIDAETCNVDKWIEYLNKAHEIAENNNKETLKNGKRKG